MPRRSGGYRQQALDASASRDRTRSPRQGVAIGVRGGMRQSAVGASSSSAQEAVGAASVGLNAAGDPFRNHVLQLFLTNKFSGKDTQVLMHRAMQAGAAGASELGRVGAEGRQSSNLVRDVMSVALCGKDVADLYWAELPMRDNATDRTVSTWMPFVLPHEMCARCVKKHWKGTAAQQHGFEPTRCCK